MVRITLENISKTYPGRHGGTPAVRGLTLTVAEGEFMVLVGPSGCGKSTLLRLVAGLETPDTGTISIGGRVVNAVPPKDRDLAMVFQNYALYPHLTVFDNLAFGLKLRNTPRPEIAARVRAAADQLGLGDVLDRLPKALSGGQRQRVAVGRALVRQPKLFLFDEPLSNLDSQLRTATRTEIARLHLRLGATMLYVTHDQVEAMTLGDRICVLKDGCIMQVAAPLELYHRPANLFVAGFMGSPPMNFIQGTLQPSAAGVVFSAAPTAGATPSLLPDANHQPDRQPFRVPLPDVLAARAAPQLGRPVMLGLRPEHLLDARTLPGANPGPMLPGTIEVCEPMGAETHLHLQTAAGPMVARVPPGPRYTVGETIPLALTLAQAHLFDLASGQALR